MMLARHFLCRSKVSTRTAVLNPNSFPIVAKRSFTPTQIFMEQTAVDALPGPSSDPPSDLGLSDDEITNLPANALDKMIRAKYGTLHTNNPGNLERIRRWNLRMNIPRWGWRMYRTTYASDSDWDRFVQIFHKALAETFKKAHGNDKHMKYMQWPVVSDRTQFDGATTAELRKHFLEWRHCHSEPQMPPGGKDTLPFSAGPNYEHFVQVDQHSLEDVLSQDDPGNGRVNVVTADWPGDDEEEAYEIEARTGYYEIEGRSTEDVGFVRERLSTIYPALWDEVSMERRLWYERPESWTTC